MKTLVHKGEYSDVFAGSLIGITLHERTQGVDFGDIPSILRAVADEIERLRVVHPDGLIDESNLNSPDFAISAVVAAIPATQVREQGAIHV